MSGAALLLSLLAVTQDPAPAAPAARPTVIALSSVSIPARLEHDLAAPSAFLALLVERLRAAGYGIVPPETTAAVWLHARDSLGGFYNTYTGKLIPAKYDSVMMTARRLLHARHGADAWLRPYIIVISRPFEGGKVRWDGVEEESGGTGGLLGALLLGTDAGTIPAASFRVDVEDLDGKMVHLGLGGIRLLARVRGNRFETVFDALATPERNAAAVRLATDSLPAKLAPTRRP